MKINIKFLVFAIIFIGNNVFAQINITEVQKEPSNIENVYAGIEISAKAVKITVLEMVNANKGVYNVIGAWNENTNTSAGIPVTGSLFEDDIDNTVSVILRSYQKLLTDFKVNPKRIFVVVSSGLAVAKNIDKLVTFAQDMIKKKISKIDIDDEAKFLIKGSIPINNYKDALVLDIGGGNTKGGIVTELSENKNYFFIPISIDFGTVTLTDRIKNTVKTKEIESYLKSSARFNDTITKHFEQVIKRNPLIQNRKNIYLSGGSIWSFITLTREKSQEKFVEFTVQDVRNYQLDLFTNYKKFEAKAAVNKEADVVLRTYSQLYLLSGTNILLNFLNTIENIEEKKIYFVNQGYVSWLKSYILETVNSKTKY